MRAKNENNKDGQNSSKSMIAEENFFENYWIERVVIVTDNYEITGDIFMPKSVKKSRLLSELLNGNRKFIAVKNCTLQSKASGSIEPERLDFLQINIASIILLKPYTD